MEWPGIPPLKPARNLPTPSVRVTTLPNGLRVTTQETYGQVSTCALFVDAGSMYEEEHEVGVCHFMETTAFKGTTRASAAEVARTCQEVGISTGAVFNREAIMYKVDTLRANLEPALAALADTVTQPAWSEEELNDARQTVAFQRDEAMAQPQMVLTEHLYTAAYGTGTPLGRPEKCPEARIGAVTAPLMRAYAAKHFTAARMVLSGVGVDHDELVALAQKHLDHVPRGTAAPGALRRPCAYLGGDVRSSPDWSSVPATVAAETAKTDYTHMMMAFPTVGWADDDVIPVCVVDTLLGGGSSFSAGGPGKGMYSRLYREVLISYSWVEACNAFSTQLYDSGLVGVYGAALPPDAGSLATVMASHLARLTEARVKPLELSRARNQLASSVMMNLETRSVLCEDIGRQFLSHGKRLDTGELVRRIQAVSAEDVIRVMRKALASPPAFAAVGDVSHLPEYAALRDFFGAHAAKLEAAERGAVLPAAGAAPDAPVTKGRRQAQ